MICCCIVHTPIDQTQIALTTADTLQTTLLTVSKQPSRPIGLRTTIKSLLGSDQRTVRKQYERERHEHCRQNAGLLEIALAPGRMRSFTPDDLPAFYKAQQEREERGRKAVEQETVGTESQKERVELGDQEGDAVLVVPKLNGAGTEAVSGEEKRKEERREAVVVPVD